jgi:putative transcriptional regulator
MQAIFVELPTFERHREDYLDDEGFAQLQIALMANPSAGDLIEGTGASKERIDQAEQPMTRKRNLFAELTEGFDALADQRAGKRTLRTHVVKLKPAPRITARELARLRKQMNLSRGLFAGFLRTNVRTLENWEQGRARPNAQAALLIRLVQRFPDTVQRLAKI